MASIADALGKLGITEWVLRGEPTSEAEFNEMFRKVTGEDDNGSAIESSDPNDFGVTWTQVNTKKTELTNGEPLKELRRQRNAKLAETDFYALSDVTMSAEMTTYRQALRDITDTYSSVDDDGFTWPTKP